MRLFLVAALFAFSPAAFQAFAQNSTEDLSRYSVGTRWITEEGGGQRWTRELTSVENGVYETKVYRGTVETGQYDHTRYSGKDARATRIEEPGGAFIDFKPHNCDFTMGDCNFSLKNEDGQYFQLRRSQWRDGDKLTWQIHARYRGNEFQYAQGFYRINDAGVAFEGEELYWSGRKHGWDKNVFKLIEIVTP